MKKIIIVYKSYETHYFKWVMVTKHYRKGIETFKSYINVYKIESWSQGKINIEKINYIITLRQAGFKPVSWH